MKTITILNHGTVNSSSDELVMTRLKQAMLGPRGGDPSDGGQRLWMLNTGVGSLAQAVDRKYLPGWNAIGGTFWAKGLDKNVEDSVAFVKRCVAANPREQVRVNMAGHSRGSMTALKIAHRLQEETETAGCEVNLFLIDPVPGNVGWINSSVYKKIAVVGNVRSAYMILAESERRNVFRPYVDQVFLRNMPTHRMDTIPGNHGGINEIAAKRHESATIVLHHAVRFLYERGTPMNNTFAGPLWLSYPRLLELYATVMLKFQQYKKQGHASANAVFLPLGGAARGDRKVQVHNADKQVGIMNVPGLDKNKYDGKKMVGVMGGGESVAHKRNSLGKQSRFFANNDHKLTFRQEFPVASYYVERLETSRDDAMLREMIGSAAVRADYAKMGTQGQTHFDNWQRQVRN